VDRIERGLTQRITALNAFLRDVYSDAKILADRIMPRELVYSCKHYRRQMRGLQVRATSTSPWSVPICCASTQANSSSWKTTSAYPPASATC